MAEAGNSEHTVDQEIVGEKTEILDKWLLALKEDLASWISRLLRIELTVDSFTSVLDTGVVLCRLANFIQNTGDQFFINNSGFVREGVFPLCGLTFKERGASQGSFIARDNVCNFIRWCRELGVPDVIMFETEDLVSNKNEKAVLLTLLEVARKVFKVGVDPPELVRLENEIDKELENESEPTPPIKVTALKKKHKSHSLDDLVFEVQKKCNCTTRYPVQRISEGKYRMGDSKNLIFVRVMRKHVMVRVGGGWDTLDRYFEKHDPCRIVAHRKTSRTSRPSSANQQQTHELFVRSPSSMSTASVSSTESYDSTSTVYSHMSVSSTPPPQTGTKCGHSPRHRTLSGGRHSPSYDRCLSPRRGSHARHKSPCQRSTPPRTIDTQVKLSKKSRSMQDLQRRGSDSSGIPTNIPTPTKQRPTSARRSSTTPSNESPAKPAQGTPGQRRKSVAVSPRKDSPGIAVKQRKPSCTARTSCCDTTQARMHSRSRSMQDLNKYNLTGPLDNDTRTSKSRPTSARARSSTGAAGRPANPATSQRKTSTSQATRKLSNTISCESPRRRSPANGSSVNQSPRIQRRSSSTPRGSTFSPVSSPRVSRRQSSSRSREMDKTNVHAGKTTVSSPGPMRRAVSNLSSSSPTSYRMRRSASFDSKNDSSPQATANKDYLMGKHKGASTSPSKIQSSAPRSRSPSKQSRVPIKIPGKQGTAKQPVQRVPTKPRSMAKEEHKPIPNGYDDLPTPFDNYSYTPEEQAILASDEDHVHVTQNETALNLDFNGDFRQTYPNNSNGSTPDTVKTIDSFLAGAGETFSTTTSDYDFPDYDSDDISGLKSPRSISSGLSVSPSPSKELLESRDAEGVANVGIMQRLRSLNVEQSSIKPTLRGKIFTPSEPDDSRIVSGEQASEKEPEERSKFFDIEKECPTEISNGHNETDQLDSPRTFSLVHAMIGSIEKRNAPKKRVRAKKNTKYIDNTIPVVCDSSTEPRPGDEAMTGSSGTAQDSGFGDSKPPSTIGFSGSIETPFGYALDAQQLDENDNAVQEEGDGHVNEEMSNGTENKPEDKHNDTMANKNGSSQHDEPEDTDLET